MVRDIFCSSWLWPFWGVNQLFFSVYTLLGSCNKGVHTAVRWPSANQRKTLLLIKGKSHDLSCCNLLLTQERPERLTSISIETINRCWVNLQHWIHMHACFYYSWPVGTREHFVGFVLKGMFKMELVIMGFRWWNKLSGSLNKGICIILHLLSIICLGVAWLDSKLAPGRGCCFSWV